jgi:hypothetical protein
MAIPKDQDPDTLKLLALAAQALGPDAYTQFHAQELVKFGRAVIQQERKQGLRMKLRLWLDGKVAQELDPLVYTDAPEFHIDITEIVEQAIRAIGAKQIVANKYPNQLHK